MHLFISHKILLKPKLVSPSKVKSFNHLSQFKSCIQNDFHHKTVHNITFIDKITSFIQDSFKVTYVVEGVASEASCPQSPCNIVPGSIPGAPVTLAVQTVSHGLPSYQSDILASTGEKI